MDIFIQFWIAITAGLSVWLMANPQSRFHLLGCWIGLAGQPGWYVTTVQHFQWGAFVTALIFTISFIRGIARHRQSNQKRKWPKQ